MAESSRYKGSTRMTAKQREAKKKRKIIIFSIEIIVILVMLALLYLVMTKLNNNGPKVTELDPEQLAIPEEIIQQKEEGGAMKGYVNIALFGVDARTEDELLGGSRSDSIMIASINMDSGDIKLVSVYRDTYLNVGPKPKTKDSPAVAEYYTKCNHAYSYGGADQAVKMLNMNLDMDIENFVTVGYQGMVDVIDGLGGVWIDVDEVELPYVNAYQIDIVDALKCDYTPLTEPGYQLLDGLQATAYCRIRATKGNDFMRATRQREVLKAIEQQAKQTNLTTLTAAFNNAIDDIYTNIDTDTLLDLITNISKYQITEEGGFPTETQRTTANVGGKGSCVIPADLEANVVWLHQFLFDDADYTVTANVEEYGQEIKNQTAAYINKNQ